MNVSEEILETTTEEQTAIVSIQLERLKKEMNAKSWSNELEEILKSWGEKAAYNKDLHSSASRYWKSIGDKLFVPILILNTVGGVANFGAANVQQPTYWMYTIGVLNLIAAGLGSISQYYKPIEKSEKHTHIAKTFGSFYRTIIMELGLNREERANSDEILRWAKSEYDRVQMDSPLLPLELISKFKAKHNDKTENLPDCVSDLVEIHVNRK
jgi:hypothetical protein|tara:strand:+ start:1490 stop:2125 length:636 start_codon:yes stop_codon:yes gene_type:complete